MSSVLDCGADEGARSQPAIKHVANANATLRQWIELFRIVEFICLLKAGMILWFRGFRLLILITKGKHIQTSH
jgi:hypothetical protein